MRKFGVIVLGVSLALLLAGCASSGDKPKAVLPDKPPAEAPTVNPSDYSNSYGGYVFRIGGGTVWCTITESPNQAVCEHREVDVTY